MPVFSTTNSIQELAEEVKRALCSSFFKKDFKAVFLKNAPFSGPAEHAPPLFFPRVLCIFTLLRFFFAGTCLTLVRRVIWNADVKRFY